MYLNVQKYGALSKKTENQARYRRTTQKKGSARVCGSYEMRGKGSGYEVPPLMDCLENVKRIRKRGCREKGQVSVQTEKKTGLILPKVKREGDKRGRMVQHHHHKTWPSIRRDGAYEK